MYWNSDWRSKNIITTTSTTTRRKQQQKNNNNNDTQTNKHKMVNSGLYKKYR